MSYFYYQQFINSQNHKIMESPKKMWTTQKQNSFIIRKTVRPPSGLRSTRFKDGPQKKNHEGRKNISENISPSRTVGPSTLGLTTTCWCLYDSKADKQLGFRQNYQRQIASLTKIMTTILTIQVIEKYNIKKNLLIRVTDTASKMNGTTANLKSGSWMMLQDLLYGAMLPSGNDAAYTLAQVIGFFLAASQKSQISDIFQTIEHIDLTNENTLNYVSEFIHQMNVKADELELIHTRFSNPHGLQNAMNISSAKDILILGQHASKNRTFRQIMNSEFKRYEYFSDEYRSQKQVKRWYNTNTLLSKGWEGIKTGQTVTAGCCLASLKNGIYIVVLNCADPEKRFVETQKLYNWYVQTEEKLLVHVGDTSS